LMIARINEAPAKEHFLGRFLEEAGFSDTASGYHMRRMASIAAAISEDDAIDAADEEEASETA
jgi:hypothetical protein